MSTKLFSVFEVVSGELDRTGPLVRCFWTVTVAKVDVQLVESMISSRPVTTLCIFDLHDMRSPYCQLDTIVYIYSVEGVIVFSGETLSHLSTHAKTISKNPET